MEKKIEHEMETGSFTGYEGSISPNAAIHPIDTRYSHCVLIYVELQVRRGSVADYNIRERGLEGNAGKETGFQGVI